MTTYLTDDFVPALGVTDAHAQTLLGLVARPSIQLPVVRQRIETPDGDFVDIDVLQGRMGAPTVVVIHGLEGHSRVGYVLQILAGCWRRGWSGVALNLRSCSGEPNRRPEAYSSGDYRDLDLLVSQRTGPVFAVGFSLGASVLLNYLTKAQPSTISAAVAVSTPFNLVQSAAYLDSNAPFAKVYRSHFLPTMKQKALIKAQRFPEALNARAIRDVKTIRDFDHTVTAPMFGFSSAEDYYTQCSSGPLLQRIRTPTLLISADDDPLASAAVLRDENRFMDHSYIEILHSRYGGHVGFVAGSVLRPHFWAEESALSWIDKRLSTGQL